MIILKVIPYQNNSGFEATWLEQIKSPDVEIPAKGAVLDLDGNESSPAEPARTEPGVVTETQVWCQSYHPTQVQMFRDKALELGTSVAKHEAMLAAIESTYIPPPPEPAQVPQVLTIRQAKLVLLAAGLLDDVDAAVKQADRATQIEWEYATEIKRTWPTLLNMQTLLNMSDEQVDTLFIQGALL